MAVLSAKADDNKSINNNLIRLLNKDDCFFNISASCTDFERDLISDNTKGV